MYTHVVDRGASLQSLGRSSLTARPTERPNGDRSRKSQQRSGGIHEAIGHVRLRQAGGRRVSHSISFGKLCDEVEKSNIWKPRENPRLTSSGVTIECCSKE